MTEDQFDNLMRSERWTPEKIAHYHASWVSFIPDCDAQTFLREEQRPDGIIPVRVVHRPFLVRLSRHYRGFRNIGLSRLASIRSAFALAIL